MDIEKVLADLKEYAQMVLDKERDTDVAGELHLIYVNYLTEEVSEVTGFRKYNGFFVLDLLLRDQNDWQHYRAKSVTLTEGFLNEEQMKSRAEDAKKAMLSRRVREARNLEAQEREAYEKLKAKYEPLADQMAAAIKEVWRGVVDLDPWVEQNEVLLGNEVLADATKDTLKDVFERELHKRAIYLENK